MNDYGQAFTEFGDLSWRVRKSKTNAGWPDRLFGRLGRVATRWFCHAASISRVPCWP